MIVELIEQGQVVTPTRSMIKGSRPFYWILLKEANLFLFAFTAAGVVPCDGRISLPVQQP